jgi:O-antigen/teichoic acid export membrane protein
MLAHQLRRSAAALPARYWVVAGQGVVSGTSFFTNIFIARLCGLSTFGEYSAWQMVLLLALSVQGALITQPMQIVHGETAPAQQPAYRQALLAMQLVFSLVAVAAVAGGAALLPRGAAAVLPAFLVCLVAGCGHDTARKLLLAEGRVRAALVSDGLSAGGQVLVLLYWALGSGPVALPAVLWAMGLTTVPALLLSGRALGLTLRFAGLRHFAGAHWRRARWLLPTALLQWASSNALLVFAGFMGNAAMLGILRLAQTLMGVLNVGLQAVENYALPRLSQTFHRQPHLFAAQRARLGRTLLLVAALPLALLFALAGPIVGWLQAGSEAHSNVLRWCCLLYVMILLVYPLRLSVRLLANARPYFEGYVSVAVSFGLARWLIGQWQASGVVLGWVVAQAVLGVYWALAVRRAQVRSVENKGIETIIPALQAENA